VQATHRAVPVRRPRYALSRHGVRCELGDPARVGGGVEFELSIINGQTVSDIIRANREACLEVVRAAYPAHAAGRSLTPDSYFLRFADKPDCRIIALPAYLGD